MHRRPVRHRLARVPGSSRSSRHEQWRSCDWILPDASRVLRTPPLLSWMRGRPDDVSCPSLHRIRRDGRGSARHSRGGRRARAGQADRRRAAALGAQTTQDVANAGSAVADRLAAVRDGLADDNRFREAVVQGALSERPYLLDYAARAMRLSGLAMLQIENDSGRILSSGHYRNEYDRTDPGLRAAVVTAPGGAALIWAR